MIAFSPTAGYYPQTIIPKLFLNILIIKTYLSLNMYQKNGKPDAY
jgi:hypothetical protein